MYRKSVAERVPEAAWSITFTVYKKISLPPVARPGTARPPHPPDNHSRFQKTTPTHQLSSNLPFKNRYAVLGKILFKKVVFIFFHRAIAEDISITDHAVHNARDTCKGFRSQMVCCTGTL